MEISVSASPNIAFIKYWGKRESTQDADRNLALNPSLSMTLRHAKTTVYLSPAGNTKFYIQQQLAGVKDCEKISAHVRRIEEFLGKPLPPFKLESSNNFPTGTGIASSASAYSALTCAFLAWSEGRAYVENLLAESPNAIAQLARRGSGSACRSLHGPFVEWNDREISVEQSDWKLFDTIVLFSRVEKSVPSSDGHKYAPLSPLFAKRLEKISGRLETVKRAIRQKNLAMLGPVIEEEALEMHAIMLENPHPVDYQTEDCRKFLAEVRRLADRRFFFTLDAGPNVHLISDEPIAEPIRELLARNNLRAEVWRDEVGGGPKISESR